MADNLSEQKQSSIRKNIHNFSWFPSILLLFQLFLLLFGLFKFHHEIVDAFNQFLQESSLCLSMINVLLIFWYWIKGAILKQSDISKDSKEFKIKNSCICVANIVLLNKLYNNNKINVVFSSAKAFFLGKNMAIYVFVSIIIVAIILIVRYARKDAKTVSLDEVQPANSAGNSTAIDDAQPPNSAGNSIAIDNAQSPNSASDSAVIDNAQPQQVLTSTTQAPPRVKDVSANVLFFIIFTVLLFVIVTVVYLLIAKYDMVTNIINDADKGSNILTYFLVAISAIALIVLSIIIVAATARSISKLIFQIPEYIRRAEVSDDRIIKIAVGIVLIPVFYGITKLFGISTDWVLNLLQNQDFLVVPFIILLYFVLSMLFVEVLYGLFSGKPRVKWLNSFAKIVSNTGDNVVTICGSIVKSFFRLLKFIPDFLESIQIVLMGEEDETNTVESEQNGQNGEGDNSN